MNWQPLIYKTTIHSVHFQFILYKICYFSWLNLVCAIPYPKVVIQFYFITLAGEGKVGKKSRRAISRCFFSSLCNVLSSRTYLQAIFSVVFVVLAVSLGLPDCQTAHWSILLWKSHKEWFLCWKWPVWYYWSLEWRRTRKILYTGRSSKNWRYWLGGFIRKQNKDTKEREGKGFFIGFDP